VCCVYLALSLEFPEDPFAPYRVIDDTFPLELILPLLIYEFMFEAAVLRVNAVLEF
jgi:hypothetical protein